MPGQTSHLPFKLNMSGVIPPIFASSLLLFPATLASFFGTRPTACRACCRSCRAALGYGPADPPAALRRPDHLLLLLLHGAGVQLARDRGQPEEVRRLHPGIRPGQQTGEYIDKVLTRLTIWGALYVTLVCLLPEMLVRTVSVPFHFGGTSLLIMVVVVMDFMAQLQAHLMSHQYEGLMKKANLRATAAAARR